MAFTIGKPVLFKTVRSPIVETLHDPSSSQAARDNSMENTIRHLALDIPEHKLKFLRNTREKIVVST